MRLGNHYFYTFIATLSIYFLSMSDALAGAPPAYACVAADFNCIIANLIENGFGLPGLVSVAAYLTGLALGVKGVLDMKTHVVSGHREMPIRTPIIELVVAGMLLALPFLYEVIITTVNGTNAFDVSGAHFYTNPGSDNVYVLVGGVVTDLGNPSAACGDAAYSSTIGGLMCNLWQHTSNLPGLFSGFSYIAGLTFMYFGALSLKQSVEDPNSTSLWVPLQRFVVASLLLVFPYTLETAIQTLYAGTWIGSGDTGYNLNNTAGGDQTLDMIVGNFVFNIYGASRFLIKGFCYIAGMTLIMIGIFRLLKTMQEGPRGPGGIGTIMTFITGAALLSVGPTMAAFTESLFEDNVSRTQVNLTVPGGGLVDYTDRMENFISAVLAYMIILGWVSFVRGLFIFRQVAEGDQQSSMMAAVTHLLGGAILVNLGPFLTAVQDTLGPIAGLPTLTFT